ncbi:hypothetical protein [Pseudofrankia asymbiotica]|uniref:Uncharacterized protein n=1 Tax=Pseudofrankia asymbiotica TaxID=1834516 RepID=A0A1V2IMK7_9ACTN|nr:hypothetical protein [Pseudofrankia asymbiotica]ONH33641.1 hypothetical protein BL253_01080 [Pseudofrankia asymbiotica]
MTITGETTGPNHHPGDGGAFVRLRAAVTRADVDAVLAEVPAGAWSGQRVSRCRCGVSLAAACRGCGQLVSATAMVDVDAAEFTPRCCRAWDREVTAGEQGSDQAPTEEETRSDDEGDRA